MDMNRWAIGTRVERTTWFTLLLHLPRMEGHGISAPVENSPPLADALRDVPSRAAHHHQGGASPHRLAARSGWMEEPGPAGASGRRDGLTAAVVLRTSSLCDGTPSPTSASGGRSYVQTATACAADSCLRSSIDPRVGSANGIVGLTCLPRPGTPRPNSSRLRATTPDPSMAVHSVRYPPASPVRFGRVFSSRVGATSRGDLWR